MTMQILHDPQTLQQQTLALKKAGRMIGFVPTMGALHEGHLALIRQARARADVLVVSIFVNPTQFGPNEDFAAYPRTFEADETLCREAGTDLLFYPDPTTMYHQDHSTWVDEDRLSTGLCGANRPGHFRGVCTVVLKLFNLVQPDFAVFGRKDAQQLRIVQRMVRDLNLPVEIIGGETVREPDGLALSSRNRHLTPEERHQARALPEVLRAAQQDFERGERSAEKLARKIRNQLEQQSLAQVDYIEITNNETLQPLTEIDRPVLVAIAVRFPNARLIDNLELDPHG